MIDDDMPVKDYHEFNMVNRFLMMFKPTYIENDIYSWEYVHYKRYKGCRVMICRERYH